MARPDRRLIEVAVRRPLPRLVVDETLVDSALEHRLVGFLVSYMRSMEVTDEPSLTNRLAQLDQAIWARSTLLIDKCLSVAEVGVPLTVFWASPTRTPAGRTWQGLFRAD
jgi:hypothetical protein